MADRIGSDEPGCEVHFCGDFSEGRRMIIGVHLLMYG